MGNKRNKQRKTYFSRSKKYKLYSETKSLNIELQKIEREIDLHSSISGPENQPPSPPLINLEDVWNDPLNHPVLTKNGPSTSGRNPDNLDSNAWGTEEDFDSIMAHELSVETEVLQNNLDGYRIVDISHLLQTTLTLAENHARGCTAGNLFIEKEKRNGLSSVIVFKCNTCEKSYSCSSESPTKAKVNNAAVWGTLATGSTFTHTEEFLSILDIPPISKSMFYEIQDSLRKVYSDSSIKSMERAGEEEKRLAIENNDVDEDGIPWITVYLDGGWAKRSYGHNYNSASGLAVIIGQRTKKVLFLGVRNKLCIICKRNEDKEVVPTHLCFKNWEGSSSAMEADIVVEGFSRSIEQHGVRYKRFIADGDSSVYLRIQQNVPYGLQVQKLECTNHIVKNYGKRLFTLKTDTKQMSIAARKLLTSNKIKALQTIAQKAIYDNAHGDVLQLVEDLTNGPDHVFGEHKNCKDYFCDDIGVTSPDIELARNSGLLRYVKSTLSLVTQKATCLIDNETNNRAELFMSIVARFNMGKRLNLVQRSSYNIRGDLSALRYNEGFQWHSSPWKNFVHSSPGKYTKKFMQRQTKYKKKLFAKKPKMSVVSKRVTKDRHYGQFSAQPEINEDVLIQECNIKLETFKVTEEQITYIAANTLGQFQNALYRTERASRLTASKFGQVIKRLPHTPCHAMVKSIIRPTNFTNKHTEYGKINESVAISMLEDLIGEKVLPSGLFIDINNPFLAASPDGLIGDNKLVEVKCLSKVHELGISLEDAAKKIKNICVDQKLSLKKNHNYYYQVQGQLNITRRSSCYFVIFINDLTSLHVEEINRDEEFWNTNMLPKLCQFWMDCICPELVLGHLDKHLKCRDPRYIVDAQKSKIARSKKN